MITLRQTILNDYETCPYSCMKKWGQAGEPPNLPEFSPATNKYAAVGTAIHETMEWLGQQVFSQELNIHDKLDERFNLIDIDLFDGLDDRIEYYNSAHEQTGWLYEKFNGIKPLFTEKRFEMSELINGVPTVTGTMDRADGSIENKEVDLIDYKTGKVYTKKEMLSNIQATIYILAFFQEYHFFPKRFIFYFSKFKKTKTIMVTPEFLTAGTTRIRSIWLHMLNNDWGFPDKPNRYFCKHFCSIQKECPKNAPKTGWGGVEYEEHDEEDNV